MTPTDLHHFITRNFGGIIVDHPWESNPEYTAYRHADNKKWFALALHATKEQLSRLDPTDQILESYQNGAIVPIVNLKLDPDMIRDIITMPGFLPAYHMNRHYWISVILNTTTDSAKLRSLIDRSYTLTAKIVKPVKPSKPSSATKAAKSAKSHAKH